MVIHQFLSKKVASWLCLMLVWMACSPLLMVYYQRSQPQELIIEICMPAGTPEAVLVLSEDSYRVVNTNSIPITGHFQDCPFCRYNSTLDVALLTASQQALPLDSTGLAYFAFYYQAPYLQPQRNKAQARAPPSLTL